MTENRVPDVPCDQRRANTARDERSGVDRRRFVGLVGASLATHWLVNPPSLGWSATAAPPPGISLVPGYLRGSHPAMADESVIRDLSDPALPPHDTLRRVIPEDLPLEFISSTEIGKVPAEFEAGCARVHIHGVLPPRDFSLSERIAAIHLEAEIAPKPGMAPFSHYVWGFDKGPVENISSPTRFDMPVSKGATLRLWTTFQWEERDPGSGRPGDGKGGARLQQFSTVLTLEDRYGEPRLRPGVYCMPLNDQALNAFPLVANRDWLVPENLPYLLFSVQNLA